MMPSPLVIDCSHWQVDAGPIDWFDVVGSGVVGVIFKATEGSGYRDPTYEASRAGAEDAGLLWGAYHFLRPGDMVQQAEFFVATAGDIDIYAADHEDPAVSLDDFKRFLYEVETLTGRTPVIYSGHVLKEQVDGYDDELAKYPLWLAQYTSGSPSWPTEIWENYWLWQYTDTGSQPGVKGYCDLNDYDGEPDDLIAEWTGQEKEPRPPRPERPPVQPTPEIPVVTIAIRSRGQVLVRIIQDNDE